MFLTTGQWLPEYGTLAALLLGTMLLSNVINNAAAVVLMAPIGISIASSLGASVDPFLMAVAIGAALPFLTPVGHQSNVLVMGPGGYAFGDYWRLGLPLSLLVVAVAVPVLLVVWPLHP
jgi:di/tricarboxylate transporter